MILPNLKQLEVWFITGSQHLYGPETLSKWRRTRKTSPRGSMRRATSQ